MKWCNYGTHCVPLDGFHKDRKTKDGLCTQCIACVRAHHRARRAPTVPSAERAAMPQFGPLPDDTVEDDQPSEALRVELERRKVVMRGWHRAHPDVFMNVDRRPPQPAGLMSCGPHVGGGGST